jgi:ketopantoate hydroxymethyltransferase
MTVRVRIDIATDEINTWRYLEINRITGIGAAILSDGQVFEYEVILSGNSKGSRDAKFKHRYHDDVLTLITKATAALRLEGVERA